MRSHSMAKLVFYLFCENMTYRKKLGVATYFCFIFKGKKQNKKKKKKTLSVTPKGKTGL